MATHNDQFAEETKYSNQDRKEEFEPFNATATDDITISHPNVGREEIELQKPLLVAMAQENRAEFDYEDDSGGQCVDAIFEEALCDVAELSLQSAGIELDDSQVPIHKLRALMILIARELDSYQELADHIATYSSEEIDQFGLQQIYEKSTYRKAAKKLKDADEYKTLIDATFIAVWALFWNGVPIPKLIKENYDLSYTAGPSAADFDEGSRQLGLYALGEDMLEIILEHLDLYPDKDGLNQEVCRRLIGAFAHAAIQDRSVENYEDTAQHLFDLDSALKGSGVRRRIDELSLDQIDEMFEEINQALLEYVVDSGIMSEPFIVSYDLTKIQSLGRNEFDPKYLTKDGRWRFAALSFTDPKFEFAFGFRILESKAQRSSMLKHFLRNLTSMADVRLFLADRGFDGAEDIEACRIYIPDSWMIHAEDDSNNSGHKNDYTRIRDKIKDKKENQSENHSGQSAVLRNAGYNNLSPPTNMIAYWPPNKDEVTIDSIRGFYTDMELPDDEEAREELIETLNFVYNQRAKIEPMFKMMMNACDVSTDSDKKHKKAFYLNMSVLFYNMYKIVNTRPAPNSGIEINASAKELLTVVRNLAYYGPTRPKALDYLLEEK